MAEDLNKKVKIEIEISEAFMKMLEIQIQAWKQKTGKELLIGQYIEEGTYDLITRNEQKAVALLQMRDAMAPPIDDNSSMYG